MKTGLTIATPEEGQRLLLNGVSEKDLQHQILDVADACGHLVFHDPDLRKCSYCGRVDLDRRRRGFPDLVIAVPPTLYLWELKTMTGRVRPEQEAWLDTLARCDRIGSGLIRPSDLHYVMKQLTGMRQ